VEPHTVVLNGRSDNRNYKQDETDQYNLVDIIELVTEDGSCALPSTGLVPRVGSVAGFVDDHVITMFHKTHFMFVPGPGRVAHYAGLYAGLYVGCYAGCQSFSDPAISSDSDSD
jgi:hypothetical protein